MGYISTGLDKKWQRRWLDYAINSLFENWLEK
jgi:hypothetical protein